MSRVDETRPLLSIIIPIYNKGPFLKRCLDSLAKQNQGLVEVIIIDDGSTDNSYEIYSRYAERYDWKVYRQKNKGVSAARNLGIKYATGKYLAFLDADDELVEGALEIMVKLTMHGYNIVQFGQYRYLADREAPVSRCAKKGEYALLASPKYWPMVWNKIYRTDFVRRNDVTFRDGMQFGEDEIFNAECLILNGGLYHAPQVLIKHHFDDENSLCKNLTLKKLEILDEALNHLLTAQTDNNGQLWLSRVISRHRHSEVFQNYGFDKGLTGRHDIVYFVKDTEINEELRYSLRSVEENFPYRNVWFYGGCPRGIVPDRRVKFPQDQPAKWERVRNMLEAACKNDSLSESIWLFNDDFFVLKPISEDIPPQYDGSLYRRIVQIEGRHGETSTEYTRRLRHLTKTLEKAGVEPLNYAVHKPMLINRQKMLEVLTKFPDEPMSRGLYGSYWKIGGKDEHDTKLEVLDRGIKDHWEFCSTSDKSFATGVVGRQLRSRFNMPSRFER